MVLLYSGANAQLQVGDPGVTFDESLFDDANYPQMRRWATAGVRGGVPPISSQVVVEEITAGNSDTINRAIQRVSNAGGGAILLRNGDYNINSQVRMRSNVSLIGESRSGVVCTIRMRGGSGFFFGNNTSYAGLYRMTVQGSWGVPRYNWNYRLDENDELPGIDNISIRFVRSEDCWLDSVTILNSAQDPVRCNATHTTLRNLHVDGAHKKAGGAQGYFFIQDGYNLITNCYITRLRHISLQGDGVEYNVIYDNDFDQEISFHSGDDGNNLIENNRITLPADMAPVSRAELRPGDPREIATNLPVYFAIMGPWSTRHEPSHNPNFIINNECLQLNHDHGPRRPWSEPGRVYKGPLVVGRSIDSRINNFPAEPRSRSPLGGTLYPIVLGVAPQDPPTPPVTPPTVTPPTSPPLSSMSRFEPVADAYLQNGTLGTSETQLRLESSQNRQRVSYLRFNVRDLNGVPQGATLRLTGGADSSGGPVTLRFFEGLSSNWDEDNLNASNAPARGAEVASFTGSVNRGEAVEVDVSAIIDGEGDYTIIVIADNGRRDLSFSSSEGSNDPVLEIVTVPNQSPLTLVVDGELADRRFGSDEIILISATGSADLNQASLEINGQTQGVQIGTDYQWQVSGLPEGEQTAVITAQDSAGNTVSRSVEFSVIPGDYADWLEENYSQAQLNRDGATIDREDANGNGVSNLLDFALANDINSRAHEPLRVSKARNGDVTVTYQRRRGSRGGVSLRLQRSSDILSGWANIPGSNANRRDLGNGAEEVIYTMPGMSGESQHFFRLRMSQ